MPKLNFSFSRDANYVPITMYGFQASTSQTLAGNNATVATALFGVTGCVDLFMLQGNITTDLGSNITAAYYRLNDQTAQSDITLATGSTLSAFKAGSSFMKRGLAGTAITVISNSQQRVNDPTAATNPMYSIARLTQKTGGVATNIEFVYTTTNTPTSGVIKHIIGWMPVSDDGAIAVL
jgi:hypothetical protein